MNGGINGRILYELKKSTSEYVSGEVLSELIGVSRTAIWKHIRELKVEGYVIQSSSRKGYMLVEHPDLLNAYEIGCGLNTGILGKRLEYFDTIDSTNAYAKKIAGGGCADGTVVIADIQTAGRGRLGREWNSSGGKGIWMSIVLRPSIMPEDIQIMTIAASIAVVSAIRSVCGIDTGIKWPNDIMLGNKKVCGILTEMNAEMERVNYLVLGIGINVNHEIEDFPGELREVAISLRTASGSQNVKIIKRSEIIKAVLTELEEIYCKLNDDRTYEQALADIISQWKEYSVTLGKRVRIATKGYEYTGTALDITHNGKLVVECDDGMRREVLSGEVSVRGMLGYI